MRLRHLVRGQRIGPELAGDGEAQRIGAPARDVALVAGDAVARAHDAAGERAAGAVVVAHLDRALETAAGAGIGRPVEMGADILARDSPARSGTRCGRRTSARARSCRDCSRPLGSKRSLTCSKARTSRGAEHLLVEFRAHDAVAVLAGMRALVGAHHVEGLLGDGAHRRDVLLEPQVEHRPHVQAADRGMRVPGAAGAVLLEDVGEPRVYSARCSSGTAQSSTKETGLPASFIDIMMLRPAVRISVIAVCSLGSSTSITPPHLAPLWPQPRPRSPSSSLSRNSRRKFSPWSASANSTNRIASGSPRTTVLIVGSNIAISRARPSMVRSTSSTAIGPSLTMCCAASIAATKLPKWQTPTARAADERRELELDPGREGERAFGADQDMREIEVVAAGRQRVEIVAADPALHLREVRLDLLGLRRRRARQVARQRHQRRSWPAGRRGRARRDRNARRSVRHDGVDREHVLAGVAVAQRARAAGIVAHHAADGGARGGRDVDREPQAVRLEPAVELVEHDAGLDHAAPGRRRRARAGGRDIASSR